MSATWPNIHMIVPQPYAQTTVVAKPNDNPLVRPVIAAFEDAMAMRSRLRDDLFNIHGFSGKKFRVFMNNLLNDLPDPRYLEIGLFHGASFCPAVYNNRVKAVGIDNWTEYGGNPQTFHDNLNKFRNDESFIQIIENDFRKVDFRSLGPFNVLFYDGSHAEKDQYDGVASPQVAMDESSILIVDDWNWQQVRKGTFDALRDLNLKIEYQIELRTTFGNEHLPLVNGAGSEWHNGCLIAVVAKT